MKTSYKSLRPESYYSDLYDRFTIEECRRIEKRLTQIEYKPKTKSDRKSKKKEIKVTVNLAPIPLYFIKGERYLKKAQTIREWMERDEARDEKLADAVPPQNILCDSCGSKMVVTMKDLRTELDESKNRVLFFFECPKCRKRRLVFENGEEWKPTLSICPKCKAEMKKESKKKGNKITTVYICPKCNYKEKDVWDLNEKPKPEKVDPNFERDRKRFCLSSEEGREYITSKEKLKNFSESLKELKEKEAIRKKIAKIKKLSVAGLRGLLIPALEKESYIKLDFSKPEMTKDVVINFTVQDNKADRKEYDSKSQLRKLLNKVLADSNWRLMSEGVNYRLGILSGRLKGREDDNDLIKLFIKK